jgi:hypothetical protein
MKEHEIYHGFSKEKQAAYEQQLIERFGDRVKISIAESHENVKNWSKSDWEKSNKEFDAICKELTKAIEKKLLANSNTAQGIIERHYQWIKQFWKPDRKAYIIHAQLCVDSELKTVYDKYHPQLADFIADAITTYAKSNLT